MGNPEQSHPSVDTLLASMSKDISYIVKSIDNIERKLESKVDIATFEIQLGAHDTYLKNLETRTVENRNRTEAVEKDIAYSKGQAKVHGGIWGLIGSVVVGVITHFFTK